MNVINLQADLLLSALEIALIWKTNIFNTDIDPGSDFVGPDSGEASIDASPGPGFRKPGPGSSHDSSYVWCKGYHLAECLHVPLGQVALEKKYKFVTLC